MKKDYRASNNGFDMGVLVQKVEDIDEKVSDIKNKLEKDYVTRDQFEPIQRIVYGMVSVILLTVLGAIVALVIRK